jgi:hypothetical protein
MIALWILGWLFLGWLGVFTINRYFEEEVENEDIPIMLLFVALGACGFIITVGVIVYGYWENHRFKTSNGYIAMILGGKRVKNDVNSLY